MQRGFRGRIAAWTGLALSCGIYLRRQLFLSKKEIMGRARCLAHRSCLCMDGFIPTSLDCKAQAYLPYVGMVTIWPTPVCCGGVQCEGLDVCDMSVPWLRLNDYPWLKYVLIGSMGFFASRWHDCSQQSKHSVATCCPASGHNRS